MSVSGTTALDYEAMISARARAIDVSGIRRVFELGAKLEDPINFSIGQPHALVYAVVISPNAPMWVMPNGGFFGAFLGEDLDVQPGAGFHLDTSVLIPAIDACGLHLDDVLGSATMASDGASHSSC